MAIPKEILSVKRPLNSIVYSYGKNNDKYGVRSRNGHKTVNGKCIPINGAVIGYIINKQFVPRTAKVGKLLCKFFKIYSFCLIFTCTSCRLYHGVFPYFVYLGYKIK